MDPTPPYAAPVPPLSTFIQINPGYRDAMTARTFSKEIRAAVKAYDHHVVALRKSSEEFRVILDSLITKAIKAYETRAAGMRHGIALDKEVTVILSQADGERPLCGIYFNLHSPYDRQSLPKTVKPFGDQTADPEDS